MEKKSPFTPEQEARIWELIQEEREARGRAYRQYLEDTREEREARRKVRMDEFYEHCRSGYKK